MVGKRERECHVLLTFRMVSGRVISGSDPGSAHYQISFTTSRQKSVFHLKNSTLHFNRTLFFEGPNNVKIFPHFINITFSPEKNDRVLIT